MWRFLSATQFEENLMNKLITYALLVFSPWAFGESQSDLTPEIVVPGKGGVFVGFTSTPSACSTSYKKTHAVLSENLELFDQYLVLLTTKMATKQTVTLEYEDEGNCNSASTLMVITSVK